MNQWQSTVYSPFLLWFSIVALFLCDKQHSHPYGLDMHNKVSHISEDLRVDLNFKDGGAGHIFAKISEKRDLCVLSALMVKLTACLAPDGLHIILELQARLHGLEDVVDDEINAAGGVCDVLELPEQPAVQSLIVLHHLLDDASPVQLEEVGLEEQVVDDADGLGGSGHLWKIRQKFIGQLGVVLLGGFGHEGLELLAQFLLHEQVVVYFVLSVKDAGGEPIHAAKLLGGAHADLILVFIHDDHRSRLAAKFDEPFSLVHSLHFGDDAFEVLFEKVDEVPVANNLDFVHEVAHLFALIFIYLLLGLAPHEGEIRLLFFGDQRRGIERAGREQIVDRVTNCGNNLHCLLIWLVFNCLLHFSLPKGNLILQILKMHNAGKREAASGQALFELNAQSGQPPQSFIFSRKLQVWNARQKNHFSRLSKGPKLFLQPYVEKIYRIKKNKQKNKSFILTHLKGQQKTGLPQKHPI